MPLHKRFQPVANLELFRLLGDRVTWCHRGGQRGQLMGNHTLGKPELVVPKGLQWAFPPSCSPASTELCFWLQQLLTTLSKQGCRKQGAQLEVTQPGFSFTVIIEPVETKPFHCPSRFQNPRQNDFKLLTSLFFHDRRNTDSGFKKQTKKHLK